MVKAASINATFALNDSVAALLAPRISVRKRVFRDSLKALLPVLLLLVSACEKPEVSLLLEHYLYQKPVVLLFAPAETDAAFAKQKEALAQLKGQDIALFELVRNTSVRIDGAQQAQLGTPSFYAHFGIDPQAFALIVISKMGDPLLKSAQPMDAAQLQAILAQN